MTHHLDPRDLVPLADLAAALGVTTKWLHDTVNQQQIGCYRISSRNIRFSLDQIDEFLERIRLDARPVDELAMRAYKTGRMPGMSQSAVRHLRQRRN